MRSTHPDKSAGAGKQRPPRVSVITIFYNAEGYLKEAVDSVLAQDFADFELLLVDDGSTDSSTAMAKAYEKRDRRIRYIEHPGHANRGMSATRNLGLREARGELIAFIDADDRWRPGKLGEQAALLERMPRVDAVGGSVNYWASHSGGKDRLVPTGHVRHRPILPPEATLAFYPLGTADAPSMSDLMFRKASIRKVGGFEEAFRGGYEDQAFLAKFYLAATLYITDAEWSDYRLHEGSCMAQLTSSGAYDATRRHFLEWFGNYLAAINVDDERIRRALDRAIRRSRGGKQRIAEAARAIPYAVPLVRSARAAVRRLRPLLMPGPAILMYHRIADEAFDPWGLAVSPDNFAEQVEWIARNRTPLPLQEFAQLNAAGRLPRDAVAVTFDDGYACNCSVAAPLLERYGVPATIFLAVELIERPPQEFWWDELERIVVGHKGNTLQVGDAEVGIGEPSAEDGLWNPATPPRTARQSAYRRIWAILYEKRPAEIEELMAQLRNQSRISLEPRESHRPLTPAEVRNPRSSLITFGSHAITHASLPRLSRPEQEHEIADSAARCEALSGAPPTTFAYPYGDYAPGLERLVEDAGYACACKADGWFVTRKSSRFALPRIGVGNSNSRQLALRLGRP